jgi:hypothetical protein
MLSAWEQHLLVWDGEEAAAACRVPALLISSGSPLSDLSRFQELTPQLVTGQTVGAGHFIPCSFRGAGQRHDRASPRHIAAALA